MLLGALDLGAQDGLAPYVHCHEELGIGNDLDHSVQASERKVGVRQQAEQLAFERDRWVWGQRRGQEGAIAAGLGHEGAGTGLVGRHESSRWEQRYLQDSVNI